MSLEAKTSSRFSVYIRKRDPICKRCNSKPSTDCSHFIGRAHSATKLDPLNCVGLCRPCHTIWEDQKKGAYKEFMIEWLGQKEFDLLIRRGASIMKRDFAVAQARTWLFTKETTSFIYGTQI